MNDKLILEVRDFANQTIRPLASKMDEMGQMDRGLISELASKGYLAATFPKQFGGMELDPVQYGFLTEEIGKACCSTRALLTVQTSLVGEVLLRFGTDEQKNLWLPQIAQGVKLGAFALSEPEIGSDAKNIKMQYSKVDGGYNLNGVKKWISFAAISDFFIVIAVCNGVSTAFIVESKTKGVSVKPIVGLLAGRASHIAEIEFDHVNVPKENIIGSEGGGFLFIASTALDHGRYSIAWAGVAVAQEALECSVEYARSREQFNEKLYKHQMIQGLIGEMVTKIHAARAFCIQVGQMRRKGAPEAVMETNMAKYFCSEVAMLAANNAVQIHGGNGCYNKYTPERLYREAKILEIIEGTTQMQQQLAANYALRQYNKRRKNKV